MHLQRHQRIASSSAALIAAPLVALESRLEFGDRWLASPWKPTPQSTVSSNPDSNDVAASSPISQRVVARRPRHRRSGAQFPGRSRRSGTARRLRAALPLWGCRHRQSAHGSLPPSGSGHVAGSECAADRLRSSGRLKPGRSTTRRERQSPRSAGSSVAPASQSRSSHHLQLCPSSTWTCPTRPTRGQPPRPKQRRSDRSHSRRAADRRNDAPGAEAT